MSLGEYLGGSSSKTKGLYRLNNNANDSSGNGANGTATNVTYVAGRLGGYSASFNGSSWIQTSTLPMNVTDNFTIINWVYLSSTSLKGAFWDLGGNTAGTIGNCGYSLGIGATTMDNVGNKLCALLNGVAHLTAGPYVGTGWHYVGLQRSSGTWYYILDGLKFSVGSTTNPNTPQKAFLIGTNDIWEYPTVNRRFTGQIDEVIVENVVWTAEQIKKYYTYSKGRYANL